MEDRVEGAAALLPSAGRSTVRHILLLGTFLAILPAEAAAHWSFRPRTTPALPSFADAAGRAWLRTGVDAFVLQNLRKHGLMPSPEADRVTLIRRLSFDLTGLPPTPDEIDAFLSDPSCVAYEKLVERFLASPHYGERWAQHWLDVVRFAESDGFEYDRYRPGMWRYRDYVIRSCNEDRSFDRFVLEQLAGDEIDPANQELQVAAGFHRLGPVRRNAGNQLVAFSRNEVLTEMTDAIGMVFLGLTVGCARCHDHRFDDFPQDDYYRLQAFLGATHEHNVILADQATRDAWQAKTDKLNAQINAINKQLAALQGEPSGVSRRVTLERNLKALQSQLPPPLPAICTVHNDESQRTAIHVLKRGLADRKGKQVAPGFPAAIASDGELPAKDCKTPRTALARWLTDPAHPLTARVFVNRVWHAHFGTGIVETPNDFGHNGGLPSHPALIDHLANEFVKGGMRLRPLHRLIVLSSTYRQSSRSTDAVAGRSKDPANRLHWQFPRRRLSAEELRDAMLAAAGRLNRKAGGESVMVPVERDLVELLYDPAQWHVTSDPREHDRRSIYLIAKRNLRLPFGQAFDQPDLQTSCPRRETSTHALQALELLNGKTANRLADAFAERLQREAGTDRERQIELAYRLTTGRLPTVAEMRLARAFLQRQPLREFALAMFNVNAFLYVD
jgi:Protein of unknown function (DUF1553)/Protein of unknown function (DUF1549)